MPIRSQLLARLLDRLTDCLYREKNEQEVPKPPPSSLGNAPQQKGDEDSKPKERNNPGFRRATISTTAMFRSTLSANMYLQLPSI